MRISDSMKPNPEQITAVKEALVSMLDQNSGENPPSADFRSVELEEALNRFFLQEHEDSSLEEFVERLCRYLQ